YLPLALLALPIACVGEVGQAPGGPGTPRTGTGNTGNVGGTPSVSGGAGGAGGIGVGPPPSACKGLNVGPSPLRRMTHVEYNNAVADLLGDKSQPAKAFPDDNQSGLFNNTAAVQSVPPLLAEGYLNSATQLAEALNVAQ